MKKVGLILLTFFLCNISSANDLTLKIQANGSTSIRTTPGATINYSILAELSKSTNEGLAMFSLDLHYSGGNLTPVNSPNTSPMNHFDKPLGLTNPAGFGGTPQNGALIQVGGAQNTIANFFAAYPNGPVVTGIAKPGQAQVLGTGTIQAPYQVGSFTLSASEVMANVIRQGETGSPAWKVDAVESTTTENLNIEVIALTGNRPVISVSQGESQILALNAGPANAGRMYWVLGSISGTSPGLVLPGSLILPLNFDWYFLLTRAQPNSSILQHSMGILDSQGRARARFVPNSQFSGLKVNHAFLVLDPVDFVSNPVSVRVIP